MSNHLVLILAAVLIALYLVPKMIEGGLKGYRKGVEIRQSQGR